MATVSPVNVLRALATVPKLPSPVKLWTRYMPLSSKSSSHMQLSGSSECWEELVVTMISGVGEGTSAELNMPSSTLPHSGSELTGQDMMVGFGAVVVMMSALTAGEGTSSIELDMSCSAVSQSGSELVELDMLECRGKIVVRMSAIGVVTTSGLTMGSF